MLDSDDRGGGGAAGDTITVHPKCMWPRSLSLNPRTGELFVQGSSRPGAAGNDTRVALTPTECRVAHVLFSAGRDVVEVTDLGLRVWGYGRWATLGVVHTTVYRLKNKLAALGCGDVIVNRRGFGYQLDVVDASG